MRSIDSLQSEISKLNGLIGPNVINTINSFGAQILSDLRKRSAVDTGLYSRNWRFIKAKSARSAQIIFKNVTPYSSVLIEGAPVGGAPWYFPNNKTKSKDISSPSGKLVVGQARGAFGRYLKGSKRRVWAGGKDPGKFTAVGGVTAGLLMDATFQKEFSVALAKAVVKDLL